MKMNFCFKNVVVFIITAIVAVVMSGCIKQKILVKVKPDGSGNILLSVVYQKNIVDVIDKQIAEQRAQLEKGEMNSSELKDPLFNEAHYKKQAKEFGTDIEYIKAKKIKTASGRGFIAVYKFKNIEDVKLDINKFVSTGPRISYKPPGDDSISFKFTKGDIAKLQVFIPKIDIKEEDSDNKDLPVSTPLTEEDKDGLAEQGAIIGLTGNETTKEEVTRKIYNGMSVNIALQVEGQVVKSNATYKDSKKQGRFTLVSIDFGKVLEDDKICNRVANNPSLNFYEEIMMRKNIKGIERECKPEITVEFKKK